MALKQTELKTFLAKTKKQIDQLVEKILSFGIDKKFQPLAKYQIQTGGKRIRALLTVLSCLALGGKKQDALAVAAALELTHNYTLIIDDIIDHGTVRRGLPSTPAKYGSAIAECIAIYYSCGIFQAAALSKKPGQTVKTIALALKNLTNGEILDILFERQGRKDQPFVVKNRSPLISEKQYFEMINKKTAVLFSTACFLGGFLAQANKEKLKALQSFGKNIGLAFQTTDDLLDMFGDEKSFGKQIGKDIQERKGGNIILLLASKELKTGEQNKVKKIMKQRRIASSDVKQIIELISKTAARVKAQKLADQFSQKAVRHLEKLPQNKYTGYLKLIAQEIPKRSS